MTTEYTTGRFPSAAFCVFSNRVFAIVVAAIAMLLQHGRVHVPAPLWAFAPCSLSNSLSSYGQYQAPSPSPRQTPLDARFRTSPYTPLHTHTRLRIPIHPLNIRLQALRYVSFPLQTLSKSAKIIPVMLMGRLLNGKTYPCVEFVEVTLTPNP